ncbi:asparagine synthase (glutamine-hydrolyzing) [Solibacillus isronensis]|uniref:asparagine synthase (glutamine-hydrolyzing) n=1 Tax=Solibacillus isronensis TaxID=412383 RepID=UPI0007FB2CA8|nr:MULTISPECIES: asparagine synthase (glutamine-hydrolyzing) [Solibacillus]OBW54691.1 asparagine synthase (glutamine-hydrolyzing) [Solibacillus silvestris]
MCGFVGFIHGTQPFQYKNFMKQMLETIVHRGPDSDGIYSDEKVTLGFRRLSILDLSTAASQPFSTENEDIVLVFNGEIYNYRELREELISYGHTFQTTSDTEVLLKGYIEYGTKVLQKIRGMFAFCIWDKKQNLQFIARDHFGIKPLYYTQHTTDNTILFGSEIKSFLPHPKFKKELNEKALRPFLTFQYPATDETFFKGVYKLTPGSFMLIQNGHIQIKSYWTHEFSPTTNSLDTHVQHIKKVLEDSVEAHSVSDVKVGSFLSGGVDSSYIAKLLKPDTTYSVGFQGYESMFDETSLAKALSEELQFENKQKHITADEAFEAIPKIQWHMDEPDSNLSSLPLYFLAELASKDVTVVLSGEGADELFGGYEWYKPSEKMEQYKKIPLPLRHILSAIAKSLPKNRYTNFLDNGAKSIEERFIGHAFVWQEDDALALLNEKYHKGPSVWDIVKTYYDKVQAEDDTTKMQYLDLHVWLPSQILLKADKMSMAHSLELRVPFLDKEVFKVASHIPTQYKVSTADTKIALRQAALDELPEAWAKRKKLGFPVPMRHWLREEKYYQMVRNTFEKAYIHEFFDQQLLLNYLDAHYEKKADHGRYVWTVYVFCVWYEQYFPEKCGWSHDW